MGNTTAQTVTIKVDQCVIDLNIPVFFEEITLRDIRKMLKLIFQEPWKNENTIEVLTQFFLDWVSEKKNDWGEKSQLFQNEYVDPNRFRYAPGKAREAKSKNARLMSDVKSAKHKYERAVKISEYFTQEKSKI